MQFAAESPCSADNTVGRTQILTLYQGNNKQLFWSLQPSDWPPPHKNNNFILSYDIWERASERHHGPISQTKIWLLEISKACTIRLFSNREAAELPMSNRGIKQMRWIALHSNKLVGHGSVTISWRECILISCHSQPQSHEIWNWNRPGEYRRLSSKQFPVSSEMLHKHNQQAGNWLQRSRINSQQKYFKMSAVPIESFSPSRRRQVWRCCFYPESAAQTENISGEWQR